MKDTPLAHFRAQLYSQLHLYNRADCIMEAVDTLASAVDIHSPVELTLLPVFHRRHYSALYQAVRAFRLSESTLLRLYVAQIPQAHQRQFHLFSVDTTPHPRPYARCVEDRGYVYSPTPVAGQKPVTVGHLYSLLAYLPEKAKPQDPPWSPFLSVQRVGTKEDPEEIGCQQVRRLLQVYPAPAGRILTLADSRYSKPAFVYPLGAESNVLVRLRCNRVVYTQPALKKAQRGHPLWYGERFALSDPSSWPEPDQEATWTGTTKKGRPLVFHAQAWYEMRMRGSRTYPMHRCPFTLVRIVMTTTKGEPVYARPLWLAFFGPLRRKLSLQEIYSAYAQRFDQEQGHRFLKQKLLATSYRTPEVVNEEIWWKLVLLAYFQLWLARNLAGVVLRPWEKYLPQWRSTSLASRSLSPALVQRDFGRIICQIGTPAQRLRPRGNPRGRVRGARFPPRRRHAVVKKGRLPALLA